eukprot:Gregarina_sp_Pseudo_9__985@NODE_1633_length_1437_cov_631_085837_g1513_i0_p1_GENE_NODE_1633_length_1437_cov_631_085837_g1513_i0NODE_1633_length_1437_cov_631_085837_g1513_i0_p1_ORF_typecomplete_len317_score46_96IMCp/PF12314_8/0_0059IMCp/PF12314_8/8_1e14IMCp/PF12314_8/1_8e04Phage_hub_GP28/PF11110_8/3_4e03Phage_hub_GP28/PF11110_8/15Phage_hub_GP28/PF11110_8/48DUF5520/PF17658_1/65DUF5520/PF17658_1/1_7e03DUF5520/PF17658_1/18_NODE_1633_length_1437_cov_631_085837_g1513_i03461296
MCAYWTQTPAMTTTASAYGPQTFGPYTTAGSQGYSTATLGSPMTGATRRPSAAGPTPYGPGSNIRSERLLGSVVLREEILGSYPQQDQVRYVEVPVVEEVIRHVPKREVVEVEKRVPRYDVEWVERIVEIPQVQYIDKHVEVPQIQEVLRTVPVRQVVEVPREVVKYVPKIETKIVEKEVEVPGEIIEIPRPYVVENKIVVPRFVDQEVTCVVAQSLHPVITESDNDFVDVEMREFNPYLVPVNVVIPRPVARQLIAQKKREEHKIVDIPVGHFNALLKSVNPNLTDVELEGKLISINGVTPIATGVKFAALTTSD